MKDHRKSRAPVKKRQLRIVVLAIIIIGLLSFVFGYWAANWFVTAGGVADKDESTVEATLSGATPKRLDAGQIISETEVVEIPKEALKKGEEKFTFTKTLEKESAPAVDPFENQKPAPVTSPKEDEKEKEKEKVREVKKKKKPAKKQVKKQVKKPAKKKKVALVKAPKGKVFTVQVGSFPNEKDAVNLAKRLRKKGYNALIRLATVKGKTWRRVQVGAFKTRNAAQRTAIKLKNNEKLPTYITSVKR